MHVMNTENVVRKLGRGSEALQCLLRADKEMYWTTLAVMLSASFHVLHLVCGEPGLGLSPGTFPVRHRQDFFIVGASLNILNPFRPPT